MKTQQLEDQYEPLQEQTKPQGVIKCIKNKIAMHVCSNTECQKYAFVCAQPDCQCNQEHLYCSLLVIKNLVQVLKKKSVSLKPVQSKIADEFDKLIDKISQIRDSLINKSQQQFSEYFGLENYETNFLESLDRLEVKDIRGKDVFKIEMNIKSVTKISQNFQHSKTHITNLIQKVNDQVSEVNRQLQKTIGQLKGQKYNFVDSSVIKNAEEVMIMEKFFTDKTIKQTKLLYRASENGFTVNKFHEKCDGKNNVVVICETEFGKKIGVYTPLAWNNSSSGQWAIDSTRQSFVYSLTKNVKFNQINTTNTSFCHQTHGPYFGASPDFSIDNLANVNNCTAHLKTSFTNLAYPANQNTYLEILGSNNATFKVKDWEVYQLQFN